MLIKRAYAESSPEDPRVEILRVGTGIKTASIADPVQQFTSSLRADPRYTYVLVNAMGYSEFYGPNSNKDWYGLNPEIDFNGLLHVWPEIGRDPATDKMKAKTWPHGYPCFYDAAAYAHHKNTDPTLLGFGDVVYVYANPHMKRVELVIRVFNDEAEKKGHGSIVSRIESGERVDVSMGAKIPLDACSICTDWPRMRAAMKNFDPAKHRHVMQPVLEEHKRKAITGVAQTRAEYCECMRLRGGKILPDGRRVFVYNDAPRFFDISFVWVGADRTARVMWHLGGGERRRPTSPSVAPILEALHALIGQKTASMEKEIPGGIASAALDDAHNAPSLEVVIVSARRQAPPKSILASLGALGIIASPREFSAAITGEPTDFSPDAPGIDSSCCPEPTDFDSTLATALAPMAATRSSFAAMLGPRLRAATAGARAPKPATHEDLSRKYAGYRLGLLKHASALFQRAASTLDQEKIAQGEAGLLLGQGGMVQWISSHLAHDLGSDDVDAVNKLATMLATPADLSKLAMALDATMRIEKTSCLRTAVRGVANTMKDL